MKKISSIFIILFLFTETLLHAGFSVLTPSVTTETASITNDATGVLIGLTQDITELTATDIFFIKNATSIKRQKLEKIVNLKREINAIYSSIEFHQKKITELEKLNALKK